MIDARVASRLYQTFGVEQDVEYTRTISCTEADCDGRLHGFRVTADLGTNLGLAQSEYLRSKAHGKSYVEEDLHGDPNLITFRFHADQDCFAEHTTNERPPLYVVRSGKTEVVPGVRGGSNVRRGPVERRHVNAIDWQEDFSETLDKVNDNKAKG